MMANDPEDIHEKLSFLPYYPYMKINIVAVRITNGVNQ